MARPPKNKKINQLEESTAVDLSELVQENNLVEETKEEELVETKEEVKPIKLGNSKTYVPNNNVQIRHKQTGRIIAMSVSRKMAERICNANSNVEIV